MIRIALLPPTSTELDVPPVAEVAAVLGIGLLYQGSGQRHISEVLLNEIGRPPGGRLKMIVQQLVFTNFLIIILI